MSRRNLYLIIQSALCILIAVLLSGSAIRIFLEGSAYQAAGHAGEWIYTRGKVGAALLPVIPPVLILLVMSVFGSFRGRTEKAKPVRDKKLTGDRRSARIKAPIARKPDPQFNIVEPELARKRKILRNILLIAAVCFTIMGILNGSMRDVMTKAIRICTECIGLG